MARRRTQDEGSSLEVAFQSQSLRIEIHDDKLAADAKQLTSHELQLRALGSQLEAYQTLVVETVRSQNDRIVQLGQDLVVAYDEIAALEYGQVSLAGEIARLDRRLQGAALNYRAAWDVRDPLTGEWL